MMSRTTFHAASAFRAHASLALLLFSAACGDGGTEPGSGTDESSAVETQIVAGDDQIRLPGTVVVTELVVQAVDALGAPVAREGMAVSWSPISGGGSLQTMDTSTDPFGTARAEWKLGPTPGIQSLDVALSGTPAVTFTARAVEPGPILFRSNRGEGGDFHLFVMNADGSDAVQITTGNARDRDSARSPDGSTIVFEQLVPGVVATFSMQVSLGDLTVTALPYQDDDAGSYVWSPDGETLAFSIKRDVGCSRAEHNIWSVKSDGSTLTKLTDSPCSKANRFPDWSPDGSTIVYESEEGQTCCTDTAIWTMGSDGSNKTQVSLGLGYRPHWHPDGQRVVVGGFADNGTATLRILDTQTGLEDLVWSPPAFTSSVVPGGVSPDGMFAVVDVAGDGIVRIDLETGEAVSLTDQAQQSDGFSSWWAGTP